MRIEAAILWEQGKPLSVEPAELDGPGPGEVLVEIKAAGVCHSDLHPRARRLADEDAGGARSRGRRYCPRSGTVGDVRRTGRSRGAVLGAVRRVPAVPGTCAVLVGSKKSSQQTAVGRRAAARVAVTSHRFLAPPVSPAPSSCPKKR